MLRISPELLEKTISGGSTLGAVTADLLRELGT